MADDSDSKEAQSTGKSKPKWLWFAIGGGILVVILGAGYMFLKKQSPAPKVAKLPPLKYIKLNSFVSNLNSSEGLHYIQVTMELKTRATAAAAAIAKDRPEIRNAVLNLLAEQRLSTVTQPKGREHLRSQILSAINGILDGGQKRARGPTGSTGGRASAVQVRPAGKHPILGVYFTAFVVQ